MPVIDPTKPKLTETDLRKLTLAKGDHPDRTNGLCVMEVAAWLAGREHSDRPPCVSPVIGAFLRSWNDSMNDEDRQMLKPYAAKVLDTATTSDDEETRAWLGTDWLVREYAPAWLRLAGLTEQASLLENLAALTGREAAVKAQPVLNHARKDAAAAWAAAGDAAGDAAWDAARAAAWDAARAALAPTTKALQKSALSLLDRMIEVGKAES